METILRFSKATIHGSVICPAEARLCQWLYPASFLATNMSEKAKEHGTMDETNDKDSVGKEDPHRSPSDGSLLPPKQLTRSQFIRIVAYNILVAVGYFVFSVLLDFRDIMTKGDDLVAEWGVSFLFTIPVAFFLANKGLFSHRTNKVRYSLIAVIALVLSAIWLVGSVLPLLSLHFAMGGSE